jgi:hypothetical protein
MKYHVPQSNPKPASFVAAALYKFNVRGERRGSETEAPPEEIIEATSELTAADLYWDKHGKRRLVRLRRVR